MQTSRRRFFAWLAALPVLGFFSFGSFKGREGRLLPTPACDDGPTPPQTEGPYFSPNSPERSQLRGKGMPGISLVLTGQVLNTRCQPVAHALLDWWHCDHAGIYDNEGFRFRGHQYTDAQGKFRLETIVPGVYPGRTRHIHVKVQGPKQPVLTTQLYFPGEPGNQRDYIFKPALVMETKKSDGQVMAAFTFVLKA